MTTKEEYEVLINSSRIFYIDKQKDSELFKTESLRFAELIVKYYKQYILKENVKDEYNLELIETIKECLNFYNVQSGPFLNYFATSFKKAIHSENMKRKQDEDRGGMKVSSRDDSLYKKIKKIAKINLNDINDEQFQNKVADVLKIDIKKIKELIEMNNKVRVVHEMQKNEEGEDISIFDTIKSTAQSTEDVLEKEDEVRSGLEIMSNVYKSSQERTKPALKKIITVHLIEETKSVEIIKKYLYELEFIDKEIIENYLKYGLLPTAREIAEQLNKDEASVSRIKKVFFEKIDALIRKE